MAPEAPAKKIRRREVVVIPLTLRNDTVVDPSGDGGGGLTATGLFCGSCGTELPPNSKFCNDVRFRGAYRLGRGDAMTAAGPMSYPGVPKYDI